MLATTKILDSSGEPFTVSVPDARRVAMPSGQHRGRGSIDAARDTDDFRRHWANADGLDADSAYSKPVRHKLISRSRHEADSNGFYDGILSTHCNMTIGVGAKLRMLTKNKNFNQLVEREFYNWAQKIQLCRKLWCMYHAYLMDGEAFAVMQTNPKLNGPVQLDLQLIEAEQVQTPYIPFREKGYIDGIKFDEWNNIEHYDVLEYHPGSTNQISLNIKPIPVAARNMLHLFPLKRPAAHRGKPAMTSTLNLGATSRRWREAVLAAAETAADMNVLLETAAIGDDEPLEAFVSAEIEKRMMTTLPAGTTANQMKSEHPATTHSEFNRSQISEQGRPISMPVNLGMCDSSSYSFASGKLDTLCYYVGEDVDRGNIDLLIMDRIFAEWFREWRLTGDEADMGPAHQFDWPAHPIIDERAEADSTDTKLHNGSITLRQVFSNQGKDLEDELQVMAEDAFGAADEITIQKMRTIQVLKNTPAHAIQYVALIMGVELPTAPADSQAPSVEFNAAASLTRQLKRLEAQLSEILPEFSR